MFRWKHKDGYPTLASWIASFLGVLPIGTFTVFYLFLHRALGIPLGDLVEPYLMFAALFLALAPGGYWAVKRDVLSGGDMRPKWLVFGSYNLLVALLAVYYGIKWQMFDPARSSFYYGIVILGTAAGVALGAHIFGWRWHKR
jgi:hypothetical protein